MKSARLWDIFCKVIDNYGDIGVCWRLAADLASRGQRVRLWVDKPDALAWMAPGALEGRWPGIQVLARKDALSEPVTVAAQEPADVWIEGFGCDVPFELVAYRFGRGRAGSARASRSPIWIDLEYLTAETYAERSHGLPSPVMQGPASGHTKFFLYPGFSGATGGLLREADLCARQSRFDRSAWLLNQGVRWSGERLVSLFCYEPAMLPQLLEQLRKNERPTRLLVTHGRAASAVRHVLHGQEQAHLADFWASEQLAVTLLPRLSQTDFDHLLWSCDLNFVRGEDSLVRAIWAGKAFVWQIYPQHDEAHHAKLQAFLDAMRAPPSWRAFHWSWNGIGQQALAQPDLAAWAAAVAKAGDWLRQRPDLTTGLLEFVKREQPGTE